MIQLVDDYYLKADNAGVLLFKKTEEDNGWKGTKVRFELSGMYTDVKALAKDFGRKMQLPALQDEALASFSDAARKLDEVCERLEGYIGEKARATKGAMPCGAPGEKEEWEENGYE